MNLKLGAFMHRLFSVLKTENGILNPIEKGIL